MTRTQLYLAKAEIAARAERFRNYEQATNLWHQAEKFALSNKQQEWCRNRSEFCQRVATKPFSKE